MLINKNPRNNLLLLVSLVLTFILCLVVRLISSYFGFSTELNCKFNHFSSILLYSVLAVIGIALFNFIRHQQTISVFVFAGMILGGAASNIYEFSTNGCISDYLNFFGLFHFNLADIFITFSAIMLIFSLQLLV